MTAPYVDKLRRLRAVPWCLRSHGRRVACVHCDRGAIIEWRGDPLCRWHWWTADIARAARAARRERQTA